MSKPPYPPEAALEFRLWTAEEGGRLKDFGPTASDLRMPLFAPDADHGWDAVIWVSGVPILRGHTYRAPVVFLSGVTTVAALPPGTEVTLWAGHTIGSGMILPADAAPEPFEVVLNGRG